jgi:hypothetical protein
LLATAAKQETVMAPPEDSLAMAERQVLEGEKYVARQVVIFDELVRDGHEHAAAVAKMVLETLQTRLDLAREHLHLERTRRDGAVIIPFPRLL